MIKFIHKVSGRAHRITEMLLKIIFFAGWLPAASVLAQSDPDESAAGPILFDAIIADISCTDVTATTVRSASFTMCNTGFDSILLEKPHLSAIGKQSKNARVQLDPPVPVKIYAGQCKTFSVINKGKPAYVCGDSLMLTGKLVNPGLHGYTTFPLLPQSVQSH